MQLPSSLCRSSDARAGKWRSQAAAGVKPWQVASGIKRCTWCLWRKCWEALKCAHALAKIDHLAWGRRRRRGEGGLEAGLP